MSSVATRVCRNRAMKPKHMDVLGDEPHEVDEQGEVSDRQFARLPDAVGRKQQHQASAEVDRVPEESIQPLLEDPVAHHDLLALVEPAQMADHTVLGARQLDRLNPAEDLTDGAGDLPGGFSGLPPGTLHHRAGPLGQNHHHNERGEHHQGELGIDRASIQSETVENRIEPMTSTVQLNVSSNCSTSS